MARRNRKYDKKAVLVDWKTGKYTVRQLSVKYHISIGTAHSVVSGVAKSLEPLINAEVAIRQEVANLPEPELNMFEQEVKKRTSHLIFFTNAAIQNVSEAMELPCTDQPSFRNRAETILKGKETVIGKEPTTAIQINNNMSVADALRAAGRI